MEARVLKTITEIWWRLTICAAGIPDAQHESPIGRSDEYSDSATACDEIEVESMYPWFFLVFVLILS